MTDKKENSKSGVKFKNGKQLLSDLKQWQSEYFISMGVIGLSTDYIHIKYKPHMYYHTYVYHLKDELYLIIFTGISFTDFNTICNEMRMDYKKLYSAYSDEEPEPEKMIGQIVKRLQVNRKSHTVMEHTLKTEILNGSYLIYLQPKKNCLTGEIIGAEALVRYCKNGIIFPPSKFIEELEKSGLISYIDLYMFEEVCKLIKKMDIAENETVSDLIELFQNNTYG